MSEIGTSLVLAAFDFNDLSFGISGNEVYARDLAFGVFPSPEVASTID
jgi:hypothetical protein